MVLDELIQARAVYIFQAPVDFDPRVSMTDGDSGYYSCQPAAWRVSQAPLLGWVWKQAAAEWK